MAAIASARENPIEEQILLNLYFAQCTTNKIKDTNVKFPKTSSQINEFTTDISIPTFPESINKIVANSRFDSENKHPNLIININGVVPFVYLCFGRHDIFPVNGPYDLNKATMEAERFDDKNGWLQDDERSGKVMVVVDSLALVYSPKKPKNKEKHLVICREDKNQRV